MRDKVKRFISILMTALMLVNLLPVGALAEGFTISNSVQSIGWWDGYPVFVFVKVEGDTTGLTMNSDHWFTLGMVESMPGVTKPPQYVSGYQDKINGVTADQVKNRMTRYKPNKSINLDGITWMGFKSDRGASDTYDQYKNQYCWHLDGSINIEELKVNYTIRYVDENNNKEIASSKTKTGKAGSFTEVEREDIKDITGYTYTGYYDPMQKLIGGKDTVINVYYTKRTDLSYTVKYLEKGTNKKLHNEKTVENQTFGAEITSASEKIDIDGYNYDSVEPEEKLTIGTGENVITFYYTKRTDLSYTVKYLEKGTNKKLHNEKTVENQTFGAEITSASEKIDIDGYNYDSVEPEEKLTIGTGENVITFYYTKRNDLSYTVNYIDKDTGKAIINAKTVENQTFGAVIESEKEKIEIDGYNYDSVDKEKLTIGTGKNAITFYYTKRNDLSYTVKYLEKDTNKTLYPEQRVENQTFGASVTEKAVAIDGYTPEKKEETITIGTEKNEITFYYTKRTDLSYTVKYLEKDTNKTLYPEQRVENQTFGASVTEKAVAIDGYTPEKKEETITIGTEKNEITFYYTKRTDLSYTVNYLEKDTLNVLHNPKVQDGMMFDEVVNSADEVIEINGYNYDSVDKDTLTIGTSDNVINIYYTKRNDLSYTVNYYWNGTNPLIPIKDSESKTATYDQIVNPDTDVPGYTLVPGQTTSLQIKDDPAQPNVLNLYYYKNVKLKANDISRVYNGAKQTILSSEGYTVITTLDNQPVKTTFDKEINVTGSGTNVGSNYTMYFLKKEIGIHNEQYYVVSYENGKLTITPRKVTLTSASDSKPYDGTPLTKPVVTVTGDGFVEGEVTDIKATGTITDVGSVTNEITFTKGEKFNEDNYAIEKKEGKLEVTPVTDKVTVTITGNTASEKYDGTEKTASGYGVSISNEKYTEADFEFKGNAEVKGTDANTYPMGLTAANFTNKSANFTNVEFVVTDGGLTINKRSVTLTSASDSKVYDGTALTNDKVTVGGDGFVEGQVKEIKATGSVTNAGSVANTITFTPNKETFKEGNYAITKTEGTLTIAKRSVLITSQSATKTYDGSALTRPAVTITGDGFVPGELAKAEATGSITKVGSTPNAIRYTTTGAFNAANYSIALSVGMLTVTEKPKPEPRRTFNLTINYVYQNGKRAAASYNRGGLKNGETFDITSPVIAGYTASETVVSGTIYNRDIKVTVIYTADGVNLDDYGVPLGLGNITMNVGDCFE